MPGSRSRHAAPGWLPILAALVVLLATGLRFYRLDAQSFWNDEGNTARLVERTLPLIIEGAAGDIHPPGYYLLLHAWRAIAGHSEFALRSYSAFCGIAMVAVTIGLGRLADGWTLGLVAGVFVAIHPLAVYYSQEARMYAQLGLAAALTLRAAVAVVRSKGRWSSARATLALAAAVALGLYTQYTYILALVGLNLAFGLHWLARLARVRNASPVAATDRAERLSPAMRPAIRWVLAHALGGALFLPWAPVALGAAGWQPPDLDQGSALAAMASTLFAGRVSQTGTRLGLAAGSALTVAGVVALLTSKSYRRHLITWASVGMAIVPGVLIAVAGIYRPAYLKFLMMSVVPLGLVWALPFGLPPGRRSLRRTARPSRRAARPSPWILAAISLLPAAALSMVQMTTLDRIYHDPTLGRDDYRGLAAEIREQGRPGDAIVLSAPNQWEVFTYYYGAREGDILPVYPAPYRPTAQEAQAWVSEMLDKHPGGRLFALYWGDGESDPQRHVEEALADQAFKAGERWVTTVRLARYAVAPAAGLVAAPVGIRLGEDIVLLAYGVPQLSPRSGSIVPLQLTWQAENAIDTRLKVFVHLVDAEGTLRAQVDMEPQAGFAPTTIWQPGDQIPDHYGLALPRDLEPGTYTILVGLYTLAGERLPITLDGAPQGDAWPLVEIVIAPEA